VQSDLKICLEQEDVELGWNYIYPDIYPAVPARYVFIQAICRSDSLVIGSNRGQG
jgi:hypothetical protein